MLGWLVSYHLYHTFHTFSGHSSCKNSFFYVFHFLGFPMHFIWGYLDMYVKSYGHLNRSVWYVARFRLHWYALYSM